MIRVAIVDDDLEDSARLESLLQRFSKENNEHFQSACFSNTLLFLQKESGAYDLIFLDIDMPQLDGIDLAKKIRQRDEKASLIFITNYRQFALDGYSVHAYSYLLKPAVYPQLETALAPLVRQLERERGKYIVLRGRSLTQTINIDDIVCAIVVGGHRLEYVLRGKEEHVVYYGTLKKAIDSLPPERFVKISGSAFVNLDYVEGAAGDIVTIGGLRLPISRMMKKNFLAAWLKRRG